MKTKTMAVASLLALSVSAPTFAATNEASANQSTSESKSFLQGLKDSPLSLYAELESSTDFGLTEYKGSKLDTAFSYKLSDDTKLKSNLRLRVNNSDEDFETSFDHGYLGYSKSKLLTEEKNGLNATGQIRFYKYNETASAEGGAQFRLYLDRKFSNKLSSAGVVIYEEKIKSKEDKTQRYVYLEGGPTYNVNKKFDLGSTVIFYQAYKKASTSTEASISLDPSYSINDKLSVKSVVAFGGSFGDSSKYALSVTPSVSYSMNDDLSATLEYEANALRMVDGKIDGRQWGNNGELALNLAYSAF